MSEDAILAAIGGLRTEVRQFYDGLATEVRQLHNDLATEVRQLYNDLATEVRQLYNDLATKIQQLHDAQTRLHDAQAQLRADLTRTRADIMGRIDRLQDVVTALRDDMAVNFGNVDQVRRANENTREEVRALAEVVSLMERQIQRLQNDVRTLRGEAA